MPAPGTPVGSERPRRRPPDRDGQSMDIDATADAPARRRVFCPVQGCPCADDTRARGWQDDTTLRAHIDAHLSGALAGQVPPEWLRARGRQQCPVCGLSVASRFGVHPTCRPEARAAAPGPSGAQHNGPDDGTLPTLTDIQCSHTPTLRHVPASARYGWAQALTRALSAVVEYNDDRAWVHLFMLPQAVLCAPPRGGRKHSRAAAAFTVERLQRWQDGERATLWASRPQPKRHQGNLTDEQKQEFATNLARHGFDKKACTALLSQGLCAPSADTIAALRAPSPSFPRSCCPSLAGAAFAARAGCRCGGQSSSDLPCRDRSWPHWAACATCAGCLGPWWSHRSA